MLFRSGIDRVRLLTNNPAKISALEALGVEVVDRVPLETTVRPQNAQYLATKRSRMRHLLGQGASPASPAPASRAQSSQPSQPAQPSQPGFPSTTLPTTPDSHDRKAS